MKFDKLIELLKEMETKIEAEENQTFVHRRQGITIICRHQAVNLVL